LIGRPNPQTNTTLFGWEGAWRWASSHDKDGASESKQVRNSREPHQIGSGYCVLLFVVSLMLPSRNLPAYRKNLPKIIPMTSMASAAYTYTVENPSLTGPTADTVVLE